MISRRPRAPGSPRRRGKFWAAAAAAASGICVAAPQVRADVVISEFGALNRGEVVDEDGEFEDWIEIWNAGGAAVDLGGFALSDDSGDLRRWEFPVRALGAGERMIVFASGNDRRDPEAELHTNFRLASGGEFLALSGPDGEVVSSFAPAYPAQRGGTSFGRGASGAVGFLHPPTPGRPNGAALSGFARDPQFSVARGHFDRPFRLTMASASPGAQIRFTTDGSEPSLLSGRMYRDDQPVQISRTTAVRARVFAPGLAPSAIVSHSYIFSADVVRQAAMSPAVTESPEYREDVRAALRALPTISLLAEDGALFGPEGVYDDPFGIGEEVEVPLSVEFFGPGAEAGEFQIDAGLRMHGGQARQHEKKPMRLHFRSRYGDEALDYPLFDGSPVTSFRRLVLRGGGHDAWTADWGSGRNDLTDTATYLRDEFVRTTEIDAGLVSPRGRFAHLFINGRYWGIYNLHERPDAEFFSDHFGGDPDEWDVIKPEPGAADGDRIAWENMLGAARGGATPKTFAALREFLGYDAFLDSMIIRMWSGDHDWLAPIYFTGSAFTITPENNRNWVTGRRSRGPGGQPFHFFSWDAEISVGNDRFALFPRGNHQTDFDLTRVTTPDSPAVPYSALRGLPDFRLRIGDRARRLLTGDGALTPAETQARWDRLASVIRPAIAAESARWGHIHGGTPLRRDVEWENEVRWVRDTFLAGRAATVLTQFRNLGALPQVPGAPEFSLPRGFVEAGASLAVADPNSPAGSIWVTLDGSDPRTDPEVEFATFLPEFAPAAVFVPTAENGGSGLGQAWRGIDPPANIADWRTGTGAVGYERSGFDYRHLIGIDVGDVYATNTSVFCRFEFDAPADPQADWESLVLWMKFDDGFAAFLNGVEISRSNAPDTLTWDSASAAGRPDADGKLFAPFDVTAALPLLREGRNVLAVHALNSDPLSSDLLVSPKLTASRTVAAGGDVSGAAFLYGGPIDLGTDRVTVKARVRLGDGTWSPATEATFTPGFELATAANMRVSEVHYHPANPATDAERAAAGNDSEFEFIELLNVGARPVRLAGVMAVDGIDFAAGGMILQPGERAVAVANRAAFEARYGTAAAARIAAEFRGGARLANGGETVTLVGADAAVIASFTFSDDPPWPVAADGGGRSLDAGAGAVDLNDAASWTASLERHGSPGRDPLETDSDSDGLPDAWEIAHLGSLSAGADDDSDGDGLTNIQELEVQTLPHIADSDGDGLSDGREAAETGTDPLDSDTDGDLLADGFEAETLFSDPLAVDTDDDVLDDRSEHEDIGTALRQRDTDGDGFLDGREAAGGSDPLDGDSRPAAGVEDLVLYATLDAGERGENGGVVPNRAGTGDGRVSGLPLDSADPAAAGAGAAFPADSSVVFDGGIGDVSTGSLTVMFWLRPGAERQNFTIASKRGDAAASPGWEIVAEDGALVARGNGSGDPADSSGISLGAVPADDAWRHVAIVLDNDIGVWRAYIGGAAVASGTGPGFASSAFSPFSAFASPSPLQIGGDGFDGDLDEVAMFEFPIGASQIARIAAAGEIGVGVLDALAAPSDSDGDGLDDAWELTHFGSLEFGAADDPDNDTLTNIQEQRLSTDPSAEDSDGDGIFDGTEVASGTDPLAPGAGSPNVFADAALYTTLDAADLTGFGAGETVFDLTAPPENGSLRRAAIEIGGAVGGGLRIDGAGPALGFPSIAGSETRPDVGRAAAVWIRPERLRFDSAQIILAEGDPAVDGWALAQFGDRFGAFGAAAGGEPWTILGDGSAQSVNIGRWQHVALVIDDANGSARLVVDGREAGAAALGPDGNSSAGAVAVGGLEGDGVHGFAGGVDDLVVWDRPLSMADVAAVFRAGVTGSRARSLGGLDGLPMLAFDERRIDAVLNPGTEEEIVFGIRSEGSALLSFTGEVEQSDAGERLEDVLLSVIDDAQTVAALAPDVFDFQDGDEGVAIEDGGADMYDSGNILTTSAGGPLEYTEGEIRESEALGGGSYFTFKERGLFVFAADIHGIESFGIDGGLGADGVGSVDGAVLEARRGLRVFRGFLKRVWDGVDLNTGLIDPSVNHLVIVEDPAGTAAHRFSEDTDRDFHRVDGLLQARRIYYLLFASRDGRYVEDAEALVIMNGFLDAIGAAPGWVELAPPPFGQLAPQESGGLTLRFSVEAIDGPQAGTLRMFSNDPAARQLDIPVTIRINEPPAAAGLADVEVDEDSAPAVIPLRPGFADPDDGVEALAFELLEAPPASLASAVIDAASGSLALTPAPDQFGEASVVVRANDPHGLSAETGFTLRILPVNDAPRVAPVPAITVDEDAPPSALSLRSFVTDVDDPDDSLVFSADQNPAPALISALTVEPGSGAASWSYVPDASGSAMITFRAVDPQGAASDIPVRVDVLPVNDAPEALGIPAITADAAASDVAMNMAAFFTDRDAGDSLLYGITANTLPHIFRSVALDPDTGQLAVVFAPSAAGVSELTIRAVDAAGAAAASTVAVTLPPVPAPQLAVAGSYTLNRQTGLLEQIVTVRNDSPRPVAAVDLIVSGLADGVVVSGAEPLGAGAFRLRLDAVIAAGGSRIVTIQYFSPNRSTLGSPTVRAETIHQSGAGSPLSVATAVEKPSASSSYASGLPAFRIASVRLLGDGSIALDCRAGLHARFAVECRDAAEPWRRAATIEASPADGIIWIDAIDADAGHHAGPNTSPTRTYRLRLLPPEMAEP